MWRRADCGRVNPPGWDNSQGSFRFDWSHRAIQSFWLMKTLNLLMGISAVLFFAPLATASIYTGSWKNKTFGSTGALTIDFTLKKSQVAGSFDFDGPVFGAGDPPAIKFKAPRKADGSGSFKVTGTAVGDVTGSFTKNGKLTFTITKIPGGVLTEARINGKFDLTVEKFTATYEIDSTGGLFANGVAEAHVPKPPTIKASDRVTVSRASGKVQAKVLTNTGIVSTKATVDGGARVTVTGKNPYTIEVKKLSAPTTTVKFTVKNADGFSKRKSIKFIRK